MKGGLRKSMTWLHTWSSLIVIWLLFAIFLTGTTAFFKNEITHWMTPEQHVSAPSDDSLKVAVERLTQVAPYAQSWDIDLPDERSRMLGLSWLAEGEQQQRRRGPRETLDAGTGELIEGRETAGGDFLYRFHFELWGLPRDLARTLVGSASMLMFIAIISGIIMHRKIFADFFTFRPGKKTASWVDAHVVGSVLALPFHIMITFSGLMLLAGTLLFWQDNGHGGQGGALGGGHGSPQGEGRAAMEQQADHGDDRGGEGRGEGNGEDQGKPRQERSASAVELDFNAMLAIAEQRWDQPSYRISISKPMTRDAEVTLQPAHRTKLNNGKWGVPSMTFDVTGNVISETATPEPDSVVGALRGMFKILHEAKFADVFVRWLFFFSGVLGTVMVGSGALLWSIKRERQQAGNKGFELFSALNLAGIAGLFVALGAYFWANRLVPVAIDGRREIEIYSFFAAWGLCLLHALVLRQKQGWLIQLSVAAGLFLLLPVLDFITSPVGLFTAISNGDWMRLGFDIIALLTAAGLFTAVRQQRKKAQQPARGNGRKSNKTVLKERQA